MRFMSVPHETSKYGSFTVLGTTKWKVLSQRHR